jgi:hypothetical protein
MDVDQNFLLNLTLLTLLVLGAWVGMLKMREVLYEHRRKVRRRHEDLRAAAARQDHQGLAA